MTKLHLFSGAPDEFEDAAIAPDRVLSGAPSATCNNVFESENGKVFSGIWRATIGSWRVTYEETEYCYIIAGRARIVEDGGRAFDVSAGDGFVIEGGFKGAWDVKEDLEKHYMIVYP